MSPFKAVYGCEPPTLLNYYRGSIVNEDLEARLVERDEMWETLREHIHKAQQIMKQKVDGNRREVEFAVGDLVYLKMRPYRCRSLARRANEKLSAIFYGPFAVEARVGAVAYKLTIPPGTKIHPTFHVS